MSKFKNAIKAARGEANQKAKKKKATIVEKKKTTNVEVKKTSNVENNNEKMVGINIKVPESYRLHWAVESKKSRSTITADIIEALSNKYGKP